jgi:uncharacterized protein YabN with tetrapyrrole methylase and pyrophosphatase domain
MKRGSLTVVGTGIQLSQITTASRAYIENSDKVLFLVADAITYSWIKEVNATAESLHEFYGTDKPRMVSYEEMVEKILHFVRHENRVCAAFYGHPGVFAYPSHEAVRRARIEGFQAKLLPAISTEDCLFADLDIDPAIGGCQSFEATDFLVHKRKFDTSSHLVLWQIGVIGESGYKQNFEVNNIDVLVDYLKQFYEPDHEVVVYRASQITICEPLIIKSELGKLSKAIVSPIATLYVRPRGPALPDIEMARRLGVSID